MRLFGEVAQTKGEPKRKQWAKGIRPFKVPDLNFKANHFQELTDLSVSQTKAPITIQLSDAQLKALAFHLLTLLGFPFHTTSFERGVQLTTSLAILTLSTDMQDVASFSKVAARQRNENAPKKAQNVK